MQQSTLFKTESDFWELQFAQLYDAGHHVNTVMLVVSSISTALNGTILN